MTNTSKKRKNFDGKIKIEILKQLLVKKIPISDIADKFETAPSTIYSWSHDLFSQGSIVFETKKDHKNHEESAALKLANEKIELLELQLAHKNEVLSEITEEFIKAKKNRGAQ